AAAAKVAEERGAAAGTAPPPGILPPVRPTGANLPQGYAYPYGGPDDGAAAMPWHGATPRRQPPRQQTPEPPHREHPESSCEEFSEPSYDEPPESEPEAPAGEPARPALPARLALPQGYRQAETPGRGEVRAPARPRPGAGLPVPS
ncbi:hypothetical protein NOD94_041295, partial [Streptomyces sp. Isolate_45]|nr:hypothetical protein [Streptomyces sp. Isolate_45]